MPHFEQGEYRFILRSEQVRFISDGEQSGRLDLYLTLSTVNRSGLYLTVNIVTGRDLYLTHGTVNRSGLYLTVNTMAG